MVAIDWTKPVRSKLSRKAARVLCTDHAGKFPVIVSVDTEIYRCYLNGFHGNCFVGQLFENIPPDRIVWMNIYPGTMRPGVATIYGSRAQADNIDIAARERIHILEIDIDTGLTVKHNVR